ncbi:hypothetical protein [Sporosarcina sp. UB5]
MKKQKEENRDVQNDQDEGITAEGLPMQSLNEGYNPLNWYTNEEIEDK